MGTKARASAPARRTGNVIRDSALGRVPETVDEIIALNGAVWQSTLVSPTLLEVVRLRNARTVNCVFCKSVRYEVARNDGLTEERVQLIDGNYQDSSLSEREKLAIALADCYLGFPAGVPPQLAQRLQAEFSVAEIAALLVALMSFNFTSRTAVSIGGMPEEPLPIMLLPVSVTTT
ncbi:MAG: carboxymuconolactone decarboxylase family protein [Proteobacteria bacterium]|nr:carboxymuconolactone decarboxylase family protein [Pseudomonadota bacterium]